jgi:hypothetical protein
MIEVIVDLLAYLKAVFVETWQKTFTFFDILGIVLFFYPGIAAHLVNDIALIKTVGALIFFTSFLLANFSLYRKLTQNNSNQADIRLQISEQRFDPSHGGINSFPEISSHPDGFNKQGLPDWASLWANIKIANIGYEDCELVWEIDQRKTKLPALFASEKTYPRFSPPNVIKPRQAPGAHFHLDFLFTERDPKAFAKALRQLIKSKKQYQVVIQYKTKRFDGESKARELYLKGDFTEFYQNILKHWKDFGFDDLVKLAQID